MGEDDNFWPASAPSQGPDGVCGPCSEVFYRMPNGNEVEIWNLVFTQHNRIGDPPDNLRPLPSRNIDTGMGLERTCAMLQGVDSNFHIDILLPLVETVADTCKQSYIADDDNGRRIRRITDHVRACTFAIHENVLPGNNEEKYVVKRLLRRSRTRWLANGHARSIPSHTPSGSCITQMKHSYPELAETVEHVTKRYKTRRRVFPRNYRRWPHKRINKLFDGIRSTGGGLVGGEDAAELYTTYGFPPELLETLAAESEIVHLTGTAFETPWKHTERNQALEHALKFLPLDHLMRLKKQCMVQNSWATNPFKQQVKLLESSHRTGSANHSQKTMS